jgi:DNA repair photolyase
LKPRPIDNPKNPWSSAEVEYLEDAPGARIEVFEDHTRDIISKNDSPDVGFTYSINPYRGCMHACAYCYARPTHEYLGYGAGTDFDTKITLKPRAPELLREAFDRPRWQGDLIVFSGNTDCYQPLEASYRLTRKCLEVCVEYRNPVGIITKAPLVERDLDLLQALHQRARVRVNVSIPFWSEEKARAIEPYVATPRRRLLTIERLAKLGIPVGVMVAPVIPGLNDEDLVRVLTAAREAGARHAGYVLLRLPGSVKETFETRLRAVLPERAERVLHRIRETRGGRMYDPRFHARGRGEGAYAASIAQLFEVTVRKLGFEAHGRDEERPTSFQRPARKGPPLALF